MPELIIKLDEHGHLFINKGAGLRQQDCPYTLFDASCGTHCPLFSIYEDKSDIGEEVVVISLCQGVWIVDKDELLDMR